ncbi:MAG: tetratricopeptide repeat protein [Gemmatimonadota bacterium]|nr:MAG: tetratricopeptide repeat protein [Gemmatimonadota bacterium]
MGWWPFSRRERGLGEAPDYFREGMNLASQEKYHEALTSFRLALRRRPDDAEIMEQMAVIYTHISMPDEAVKFYEQAIETGANSPAAHYGLAFIYLHRGDTAGARRHLRAFLVRPPEDEEAAAHVEHARRTLRQLEGSGSVGADLDSEAGG